ncbi:MAG: hypothetical protein MK102_02175 [Fuerstiella sp.]|nr:hypothetical protein [Fuerstiella sp.]
MNIQKKDLNTTSFEQYVPFTDLHLIGTPVLTDHGMPNTTGVCRVILSIDMDKIVGTKIKAPIKMAALRQWGF